MLREIYKVSTDTSMNKIEPVFMEKKDFESREKT